MRRRSRVKWHKNPATQLHGTRDTSPPSDPGQDKRKRLHRLEAQKQRLIEAYLAEALAVADRKERQAAVSVQIADAQRLTAYSQGERRCSWTGG